MLSDEALGVLASCRGSEVEEATGAAFVDGSEVEEVTRRANIQHFVLLSQNHVVFLPKVDDATSKGNERRNPMLNF